MRDATVELHPPPDVVRIADRLEGAGYSTWAVGGAVRDALAGGTPGDWDLATAARPADVQRLFRRTVPVGVEHGTVGVLGKDGRMYEVTTFRRDVETFGRKARVAFSDTIDEDLARRDFTINAVAWHPLKKEVRDPFGGRIDLEAGVLRAVGDPPERFREDRLRVLRALRFAGRFGLRIEPETWTALSASVGHLGDLSAERIREELYKVLSGPGRPSIALGLYQRSGVLRHLYPELEATVGGSGDGRGDLWERLLATTDALPRSRPVLRLAGLLHGIGAPGEETGPEAMPAAGAAQARGVLQRLKASNADRDRVVHLIAHHRSFPAPTAGDAEVRRWLRRVGLEYYRDLLRLGIAIARATGEGCAEMLSTVRVVRRVLSERPILDVAGLAIGGAELRQEGLPPGPLYSQILGELLEAVLEDPSLNERERLLELVRASDPSRPRPSS